MGRCIGRSRGGDRNGFEMMRREIDPVCRHWRRMFTCVLVPSADVRQKHVVAVRNHHLQMMCAWKVTIVLLTISPYVLLKTDITGCFGSVSSPLPFSSHWHTSLRFLPSAPFPAPNLFLINASLEDLLETGRSCYEPSISIPPPPFD